MKRLLAILLLLLLLSSCAPTSFSLREIKDLEPYSDKTENVYRFYPDYVDSFIPSEEYGKVYPYVGENLPFSYGYSRVLYGFCSEDGGIICDPVYQYYDTILTESHSYYVMQTSDATRSRTTVIRDDGRAVCTLDGASYSFQVNNGHLQYRIWEEDTLTYKFLTPDLQISQEKLEPITPTRTYSEPPDYSGRCPSCGQVVYSGSTHADVYGYPDNHAYFHHDNKTGKVDIFSTSGAVRFSIPLDSMPGSLSVTRDIVFGYRRHGSAFLYDRHGEEFIPLPAESMSFSLLSDNFLRMSSSGEDGTTFYLYDVAAKTVVEYDMAIYINGCLITLRNGVSRVTRDGQDLLRLRLLVD